MNGRVNHILSEVEVDVVLVLVLGEHLVPRGGGDILKRLPGPAARPRALTLTSTSPSADAPGGGGGGGGEGGGFECAAYALMRGGGRVGWG